jgi:hypothetical protein
VSLTSAAASKRGVNGRTRPSMRTSPDLRAKIYTIGKAVLAGSDISCVGSRSAISGPINTIFGRAVRGSVIKGALI